MTWTSGVIEWPPPAVVSATVIFSNCKKTKHTVSKMKSVMKKGEETTLLHEVWKIASKRCFNEGLLLFCTLRDLLYPSATAYWNWLIRALLSAAQPKFCFYSTSKSNTTICGPQWLLFWLSLEPKICDNNRKTPLGVETDYFCSKILLSWLKFIFCL